MPMRSNGPFIAGFIPVVRWAAKKSLIHQQKSRGPVLAEMITSVILSNCSDLQAALQAFSLIFDSYDSIYVSFQLCDFYCQDIG